MLGLDDVAQAALHRVRRTQAVDELVLDRTGLVDGLDRLVDRAVPRLLEGGGEHAVDRSGSSPLAELLAPFPTVAAAANTTAPTAATRRLIPVVVTFSPSPVAGRSATEVCTNCMRLRETTDQGRNTEFTNGSIAGRAGPDAYG